MMQSSSFPEHNVIQACILVAMSNSAENENYSGSISWSLTLHGSFLKAGLMQKTNLSLRHSVPTSISRIKTLK